jgi:putative MATE family efflux protein
MVKWNGSVECNNKYPSIFLKYPPIRLKKMLLGALLMNSSDAIVNNSQLYKNLIRIALPIALQSLISSTLNLVDTLMIGQLGELELASVGLSVQLYFVQYMLLFGLVSGASTFISQFWGIKDLTNIRKVVGFTITVSFCASMLFFVPAFFFPEAVLSLFTDNQDVIRTGSIFVQTASFTFLTLSVTVPLTSALRSTEQTDIPLKISILVFFTNTLLNYMLIFGHFGMPALGVQGSAIATLIARCLELVLVLYVIFIRKNLLNGHIREFFTYSVYLAQRILNNAIPTTVNEVMWGLGMVAYNAAYGRMGITEFASVQASNTINTLFILAVFSLGDATLILVGKRLGAGEFQYAFVKAKKILKLAVIVGACSGLLLIAVSPFIISLFNFTEDGITYARYILLVYGLFMSIKVFNGINITGPFRAGGDTKFAMITEVCCVWLIGVPLVFIGALYLHLPIYYVVLMAQAEEIVKFIICYNRFRSRKWVNNMIRDIG